MYYVCSSLFIAVHRNHLRILTAPYLTAQDERMKVWVSDLNEIGNLNGVVGDNASLKCNAEGNFNYIMKRPYDDFEFTVRCISTF